MRLKEFDFIRMICVLAVILIHITAAYISQEDTILIINQLTRFTVPVFVILSGYFAYYQNKKELKIFKYYKHKLYKIFIPYLIWTFIYSLYYDTLNNFKANLLFGTAEVHMYFVVVILQLYLLFPFIRYVYNKSKKICLSLGFIISIGCVFTNYYLIINNIVNSNFNTFFFNRFFGSWIIYFIIGMYLVDLKKEFSFKKSLILWIIIFEMLFIEGISFNTVVHSNRPLTIIYAIVSFYLLYKIGKKINLFFIQKWIAENAYYIYLSHILFFKVIEELIIKRELEYIFKTPKGILKYVLIVFLVTSTVGFILNHVPFSNVFGVKNTIKFRE